MYENMSEQVYDFFIRYGSWRTRVRARALGLIRHIKHLEQRFLPLCDHIFVVVEEAKQFLVDRYRLQPSSISVVHNVERLDDFDSIPQPDARLGGGDFLISYVGGFGPHRGIERLVAAAGQLAAGPHPPFRVALVGAPTSSLSTLHRLIESVGAQHVLQVLELQPHIVAMQWIKQSDLGVIPHVDTPQIRTTIPNKLFQYMAAGVGVACSDVGPLGRIVRETRCGSLFPADSVEDLAGRLSYAIQHPDENRQMGLRGREAAELHYRWEIEAAAYENVFGSVLPSGSATRRSGTLMGRSR
jgi:glycosyltransferase involved in cell wall biosynthesis